MTYFDWDEINHSIVKHDEAPAAARLAFCVVPDEQLSIEWQERVRSATKLPQLSLVEWSVCDEVVCIFELLRDAGSSKGFVVQQGEGFAAEDTARMINLDDATARQLERDRSIELPMAFVDDQAICILASYFSDFSLIGLREDLFNKWLEKADLDLTLWADEPRYPRPQSITEAQSQAARRQASWREYIETSRRS